MIREDCKIGQVVSLRSGGLKMTIAALPKDEDHEMYVFCVWHDLHGKMRSGYFLPEIIQTAMSDEPVMRSGIRPYGGGWW